MTHDHIVLDPAILAGKPVVRGTRLSVEFIIGLMADGWNEADILANYPGLCTNKQWCSLRPSSTVWQNISASSACLSDQEAKLVPQDTGVGMEMVRNPHQSRHRLA